MMRNGVLEHKHKTVCSYKKNSSCFYPKQNLLESKKKRYTAYKQMNTQIFSMLDFLRHHKSPKKGYSVSSSTWPTEAGDE